MFPAYRLIFSILLVGCLLAGRSASALVNTHGLPSQGEETMAYFGDFMQSYVESGCLHPTTSGTTVVLPACRAYARDLTNKHQLRYLAETTPKTLNYSAGNGTYWLIARAQVAVQPAGWTCVAGTAYCWLYNLIEPVPLTLVQPPLPNATVMLARVSVLAGNIVQVGDLRQDSPLPGQPINALSSLYGVVGDDTTDDTAALQAVLNAASWQPRRVIEIPQAPKGACYAFTKLFFHHDAIDNPGWNFDTNAQGRVVLKGGGSLTLRDQIQNIPMGTCLRSTHPVGPAINIFSQVGEEATVTNSQRTEFRDLNFKANNTTAVIRVNATTTNTWQNVSVEQENNTVGDGVQIWDSFLFKWEGGNVLGAGVLPLGTGIGVHVSMPENTVAGLVEFSNMTARNWGTCWQFGNDDASSNRLTNLLFSQVQGKGCSNHAMLLWAELRAVSVVNSYFEEYTGGLSVAGNNRAVNITGNYFAGTFVSAGRSSVTVGIGTAVTAPKTARQVSIRLNSFSSVPLDTSGVRLQVRNTADNGREVAFNEFVGLGVAVEIISEGGNLHQTYIYGNDYGTLPPENHLVFTPINPGDPPGRVDYYGQDGFTTIGSLQQRLIGNRVAALDTDTALVLNTTSNLQRVQATVGIPTITDLSWLGGTPVTGTEFCLVMEQSSQDLIFAEGGNLQLEGDVNQTLTSEGSTICFVYFNDEYQQSRKVVQHGVIPPAGDAPPSGPAGGGLAGTYPNPTIATNAVGSAQVTNDSLTGTDINETSLALPARGTRPLTCVPSAEFIVNATTKCLEVCNAAGNGWDEQPGCSGGLLGSTTGIQVDTDSVRTLRYSVSTTSTSMTLDQHLILLVNTLGADLTISLPDPADPLKPGYYEVIIDDEVAGGSMRIAPTAGATINGVSTPTAYITGKGNYFVAMRLGNTAWRIMTVAPVAVGDVFLGANNTYGAFAQNFSAATVTLPAGITGYVEPGKANTYGAFAQNFSAATVTLPAGITGYVEPGEANTWGAFAQSFAASTSLIAPTSAGYAPTANGSIGFDSTKNAWVGGGGGVTGTFSRIRSATAPGETKTNSTTAEQSFTSVYTIPANFFTAGKILCLTLVNQYITDAAASGINVQINLGATRVHSHSTTFAPPNSANKTYSPKYCFYGTAAPGASVNVVTSPHMTLGEWEGQNSTVQPVLLATNGTLTIVPTVTYVTDTGGESFTILHALVEEIN